jgi:hypothetical protein
MTTEQLSPDTPITELFEAYPFLVDFLVSYRLQYGLLESKRERPELITAATIRQFAELGELAPDKLIADIGAEIARRADTVGRFDDEDDAFVIDLEQ